MRLVPSRRVDQITAILRMGTPLLGTQPPEGPGFLICESVPNLWPEESGAGCGAGCGWGADGVEEGADALGEEGVAELVKVELVVEEDVVAGVAFIGEADGPAV